MTHFHGTSILVRAALRPLPKLALWAGLVLGAIAGLCFNLGGGGPGDLALLVGAIGGVVAFCSPLGSGAGTTVGAQPGQANAGYGRREELLTLPIGRLAIPASNLLSGLIYAVVWGGSALVGLAGLVGPGRIVRAVATSADAFPGIFQGVLAVLLLAQLLFTAVASIGGHRAALTIFLPALPLGTLMLLPLMGYTERDMRAFALVCWVILAAYYLVLPFLLYLRPRHLWSSSKAPKDDLIDLVLFKWSILLPLAFVALGMGRWLLLIVAAAGVMCWRARRHQPPASRRPISHLRLATILGLVGFGPIYAVGAVIDACRVNAVRDLDRGRVVASRLSPDGRTLALEVVAGDRPADQSDYDAIRLVHVIDLRGDREPIILPSRFALLAGDEGDACWSSDGRYLAVFDQSVGRMRTRLLHGFSEMTILAEVPWERVVGQILRGTADTVIYDTHTGDVAVYDALVCAPGWERPESLVSVSFGLSGDLSLQDVSGRELAIPLDAPLAGLIAYREGVPVFAAEGYNLEAGDRWAYLGEEASGLPRLPLTRWTSDGLEAWDPTVAPATWAGLIEFVEVPSDEEGKGAILRSRYSFLRGDQVRTLEIGVAPLLEPSPDGVVLVRSREAGIQRLHLADGSFESVATPPTSETTLRHSTPDGRGGVFTQREDDQRWLHVSGAGLVRDLPAWVAKPLGWQVEGELVAWDDRGRLVVTQGETVQVLAAGLNAR